MSTVEIKQMFQKDINRSINGVIKVNQDDLDVIRQEVDEYVITEELKKHFKAFFEAYSKAFSQPTADIGVWIAGFFGSGKSHFLKILSYLLDSRQSAKFRTKESFAGKLEDDRDIYQLIDKSTQGETEAILFNIDIEGPGDKNKTAVLRVFTKMFYNHLGFYGEDLKTARLEQYLSKKGKLEEFKRVFEEKLGDSWEESRDAFSFHEDEVIESMVEVLGMSEASARDWFNAGGEEQFSIAHLVKEIKAYVDKKPDDYRLLFMIDEVGQYIGTDRDMLLNFQSIVEELGSKCKGKVWVMATGQEALDEVIKVRQDEFSRIMARFKTRLSLSSSSVDEVIQRRILAKTEEADAALARVYDSHAASLENLFVFKDTKPDVTTYRNAVEFQVNYPFVPYQFLLLQKVYYEVRKHGNTGKHLAGGERSMLSGFQEVAQKIQDRDETALAPFYRFYDTMVTFLDGSIRRVVDRCEKAAKNHEGLEAYDVSVLKCLYLIRYVEDDMPANADNVMILMADHIDVDKVVERAKVQESLDRLLKQNYVGRTGDVFKFLTDEEQDMQKEIVSEDIAPTQVTDRIGHLIFSDIYPQAKYRYDIYDFPFQKQVDGSVIGAQVPQGMALTFLTDASDVQGMSEMTLIGQSKGQAIIALSSDSPYFTLMEEAMKIRQYINHNVGKAQSSKVAALIAVQEDKASKLEARVMDDIRKAISLGQYYVDGEHFTPKAGDAKSKINQSLEYLVKHTYSKLDYITKHVDTDEDVAKIIHGQSQLTLSGHEENEKAAEDMETYLEMRDQMKMKTTMAEIQSRYQAVPYGWREIDVAAVVGQLLWKQAVTLKRAGGTVRANNPDIVDYLRKRSEIGKTTIAKRRQMNQAKVKKATEFLEEYLEVMSIPKDENGLVNFITENLGEKQRHYEMLLERYKHYHYPGRQEVQEAARIVRSVLEKRNDDFALVDALVANIDAFNDILDDLKDVEDFFDSQAGLFEEGVRFEGSMKIDMDYIRDEEDAYTKLNRIRAIILVQDGKVYDYSRLHELRGLIDTVRAAHDKMVEEKRREENEIINQCMTSIYQAAGKAEYLKGILEHASDYYKRQRDRLKLITSVVELSGISNSWFDFKDKTVASIEGTIRSHNTPKPVVGPDPKPQPPKPVDVTPKKVRPLDRRIAFPVKVLASEQDIDEYLEQVRKKLLAELEQVDEIRIK